MEGNTALRIYTYMFILKSVCLTLAHRKHFDVIALSDTMVCLAPSILTKKQLVNKINNEKVCYYTTFTQQQNIVLCPRLVHFFSFM